MFLWTTFDLILKLHNDTIFIISFLLPAVVVVLAAVVVVLSAVVVAVVVLLNSLKEYCSHKGI